MSPHAHIVGSTPELDTAWRTTDLDLSTLAAPDVAVVGPLVADPVREVQRLHALHADAAIVVVLPASRWDEVRGALRYAPATPSDLDVVSDDPAAATAAVSAAAHRAAAGRVHRDIIAALNDAASAAQPAPRRATVALGSVLDHAPLGVLVAGPDLRVLTWNARAAAMLGGRPDDIGRPLADVFEASGSIASQLQSALMNHGGDPRPVRVAAARAQGLLELTAVGSQLDHGHEVVLVLLVDITEQAAAEAARDALTAELETVRRSQAFLLRASDVLIGAIGQQEMLDQLTAIAVPTLGDLCVIDLVEDGRLRRAAVRHADPALQPLADALRRPDRAPVLDAHPAVAALRNGVSDARSNLSRDDFRAMVGDDGHLDDLMALGIDGYVVVPLVLGDQVLGTVSLASAGRLPDPIDVALAEQLADRVAQVVATTRVHDRDRDIAEQLQRSLLPALPDVAGVELAARYAPASLGVQVGGDWFDAFPLRHRGTAVVIGDVVGHDLAAVTKMGQLRNALRGLAHLVGDRPGLLIDELNALNSAAAITGFATLFYGTLHDAPVGAILRWANAGHPPPLLVNDDGSSSWLQETPTPVIGLATAVDRDEHSTALPPGSLLLLYTDGLVERRGAPIDDGMHRLRELVLRVRHEPLEAICDVVLASLGQHSQDDVAVLAVRTGGFT